MLLVLLIEDSFVETEDEVMELLLPRYEGDGVDLAAVLPSTDLAVFIESLEVLGTYPAFLCAAK